MARSDSYVDRARNIVLTYKLKDAKAFADEVVADKNSDLSDIIKNGLIAGINEVGKLYAQKKVFLPHIINAANVFTVAFDTISPELQIRGGSVDGNKGKVVICTIEGDIHTIGKDIVATMLKVAGFTVYNIGRDVSPGKIIDKTVEYEANVVATSALMTSTSLNQKEVEEALKTAGIRKKVITNIGGAAANQKWADEIGADTYSENSDDAVIKIEAALAAL